MNFVSAKTGVREYLRLSGHKGELNKSDILAWTNDAVSRIITDEQLIHKIKVFEVIDYKTELPDDFVNVIQAAYLITEDCVEDLAYEVSKFTDRQLGCQVDISLKCPKCHKVKCSCNTAEIYVDVDRLWRSAHPEHVAAYMQHFYNYGGTNKKSFYSDRFQLMRPATSSFFHIKNCVNIDFDSEIQYTIQPPNLLTNFKEGKVLLSYFAKRTDEDGYLLVPDEPVVFEAISWYIQEKMLYRKYMEDFSMGTYRAWQDAFQLREKFIARARGQIQIPSPDVWKTFIKRFIHRTHPNWGHEEDMYRTPSETFTYPDQTYNIKPYTK